MVAPLSEDSQLVRDMYSDRCGQVIVSLSQFLGGIGYALYLSWQLTIAMMLTAPIMGVAIALQGYLTVNFTKRAADASASALSIAEEVISCFRTVRSFSQEHKEQNRYAAALDEMLSIAHRRSLLQGFSLGFVQAVIWGACAVAFWVGGWLVGGEKLDFGDLVTVFGMMLFAVIGLSVGLAALPQFLKAYTGFTRLRDVIEREPKLNSSGGGTLPYVTGRIDFENVVFQYATRDTPALKGVTFSAEPGHTIAFVGESGSGKSTIFNLLERFYDPVSGAVCLDGQDLRTLDLPFVHEHVAIVSQEPVLFSTTIAENIAYACKLASMKQIIEAAKTANAHEFIEQLPDGYNTKVGERGVQLSGGQKQRVAIARAVLCNPKVLLLDEATSALDTQSEKLVQDALDRIMVDKTCLVIAHRLSTVQNASTIVVLDQGNIIECGTHDQLLAANGAYTRLATRQLMQRDEDLAALKPSSR